MATYNGEKYIKQQIESILAQLSDDDEVIISDDSSTDNTIGIIKSFNDKRLKVFVNTHAKGPVGNFATALANASFDFIFLADQDDLWLEGKVKRHMELMQQFELVVSDAIVVTEDGTILFESFFKARNSGKGFFKNLKKNSYLGCCMSFRRSLLNKAFPFPKKLYMHDWWLGLVAEIEGNICFCEEKFLHYIRHTNNATQTLQTKLPLSKMIANRWGFIKALIILKIKGQF
ncbi:glycosyltransferase involved in cell wall biosynthesis [Mucilaginibacter pocheonensis]|uniref:Glycosyltransferase involved in cell wall biosynthesis n=2 Tax=Mucilaginibacter pocheonensis TaxID=398050 RepID=A0ABU1T710_9SPHI|nr:glycosyltransferase involved in cell wall biosynthesis [Mucilaginibacter pocheonensis]